MTMMNDLTPQERSQLFAPVYEYMYTMYNSLSKNELQPLLKKYEILLSENQHARSTTLTALESIFQYIPRLNWLNVDNQIEIKPQLVDECVEKMIAVFKTSSFGERAVIERLENEGPYKPEDVELEGTKVINVRLAAARGVIQQLKDKLEKAKRVADTAEPEAPQDAVWGQYAFGSERTDTPHEKDTEDEEETFAAINDHFSDGSKLPKQIADKIKSLVDAGLYEKLLKFPEDKFPQVYRGIVLTTEEFRKYIGDEKPIDDNDWHEIETTGTVKPRSAVSSWTTDYEFAEDFTYKTISAEAGRIRRSLKFYRVVLTANVADNPKNTFILNPQNIYNVQSFNEFSAEKETIADGPVTFCKISYQSQTNSSKEL